MDAGLRMDGIPALDLLGLVIDVLHSSQNIPVRGDLLRDEDQRKQHCHAGYSIALQIGIGPGL